MTDSAQRPRRSRVVWITLIVLGVVVLAAAGVFASRVVGGGLEAATQLDRATLLVERAGHAVVAVDEVVRTDVSPAIVARAKDVGPRVAPARIELEEALRLVDSAMPRLTDDEQRRATLLKAAAAARVEMLDAAPAILSANIKAADAMPLAIEAWASTLAAGRLADRAVGEYNKLTKPGVQAGATFNAQAEGELAHSRDLFSRAATAFPEARLERYATYLDQKAKQVALLRRAAIAWLAGRFAEANGLIVAYNAQGVTSAATIRQLPATPSVAVADAHKLLADSATATYFAARTKASTADKAFKAR